VNLSQPSPEEDPANATGGVDLDRLPAASFGVRSKALLLTPLLIIVTLGVGWLAWSVLEWWNGRTPSYRRTNLRVVRKSDGKPIGLVRSILREVCCAVLLLPTLIAGLFIALGFAMGASPPEGIFSQARSAPWDFLTRTEVVNESSARRD
jgi:hypothetical protein